MGALIDEFVSRGFVILRGVVQPPLVHELRQRLISVLPSSAGGLQFVVPRLVELDDRYAALADSGPHLPLLTEIFGATPHLVNSYGHSKPARTPAHTGLHSDVAHLRGVSHPASLLMVKVTIALTPAGEGEGATLLRPGSQHLTAGEPVNEVYATLGPGDLLLFHANIRHTSTANNSPRARLGLWFTYAQPWMRVFPGHEYDDRWLSKRAGQADTEPHLASIYGLTDPYATGK